MTEIVDVSDLPTAIQSAELVETMVAAANAKASRVAPCLTVPLTAWAAATAYTAGQTVKLPGSEALRVTVAGTSAAAAPTAPVLDSTVVDGSVTWQRIGPTTDLLDEARLILIGAIHRWTQAGTGAIQTQGAGPFAVTVDTRQRTGYNLWPSEIAQLQELCKTGGTGAAFSIDTAPCGTRHLPWCSMMFGATYCSCGVDIAGYPIFETG